MQRLIFAIIATAERVARVFGLDIHTTRDDSGAGPFAFESRDYGKAGREFFGLGLRVTVSPLPVGP